MILAILAFYLSVYRRRKMRSDERRYTIEVQMAGRGAGSVDMEIGQPPASETERVMAVDGNRQEEERKFDNPPNERQETIALGSIRQHRDSRRLPRIQNNFAIDSRQDVIIGMPARERVIQPGREVVHASEVILEEDSDNSTNEQS